MISSLAISALPTRSELVAVLASTLLIGLAASPAATADEGSFNDRGNILIADQYNNRVIEIDRDTHKIVWQFGSGSDKPGSNSVVGTNDAERVGTFTLISGTGIPSSPVAAPLPGCSDPANGCPDNRVFIVNRGGHIVWRYGQDGGVSGSGFNQLNTPVHALFLSEFPNHPGFHVMITDQANERVIVVNAKHQIVWQYGTTGVADIGPNLLNNPNSAELLENGHVLIADENNNRVIEVTRDKEIVFQQGRLNVLGSGFDLLNGPYDAKAIGDYTGLTPPFDWDTSEMPTSLR